MPWTRRQFVRRTGAATAALALPGWTDVLAGDNRFTRLVILHTNDIHSRLDPFPEDGSKSAGLGGAARRAAMIADIRRAHEHVLLFDAGDIFQGTPYFNFFLGEPDIKSMQMMGYDAVTMGNHDFDAGLENFEAQMRQHAAFPVIIANYDFSDTVMHDRHVTRRVFRRGPLKIGVTGVGIALDGLVPKPLYGQTRYMDPIEAAVREADILRHDERCDLVICLSHLGYKYETNKVSDIVLARESRSIDIIIGGHTHTFMDAPDLQRNREGAPVLIHQVGWGGQRLGKIEMAFERNKPGRCVTCDGIWVQPTPAKRLKAH